jgi:YjbE family integral membrane protein
MHLVLSGLSIVLIDLLLAGDNALVIAMAVRTLPVRQRLMATAGGAAAAVVLRIALTFAAAQLLGLPYLQLAGGLFVLWIAVKVLRDVSDPPVATPAAKRLWQAIRYIVVADITMSADNVLAVAGASHGSLTLIVFGLCVSIPFVVLSANLLVELMNRFPFTIYLGVAILGKVAADMIFNDPLTMRMLHPTDIARYIVEAVLVAGLWIAGYVLCRKPAAESA